MDSDLLKKFKIARKVSAPLLFIQTPEPANTISYLCSHALQSVGQDGLPAPQVIWDTVRGITAVADADGNAGEQSFAAVSAMTEEPAKIVNLTDCLELAQKLPKYSALFIMNAHRWMSGPDVVQAIWNLRDQFKVNKRTLIMLGPSVTLPPEIAYDVLVLDEPLPTPDQLGTIVRQQYDAVKAGAAATGKNVSFPALTEESITRAVDATVGLSSFAAEQIIAMSIDRKIPTGIDHAALWERKRRTIEQTPGLSVWNGTEKFSDLKGIDNAINFLTSWLQGTNPVRAILFMDEIEKMLAGIAGDNTGVSQDMFGVILQWMQDTNTPGLLSVGPPGSGKSQAGKAASNVTGIPNIKCDLGGMKSLHVGDSERQIRQALKVTNAVSRGQTLVIATCNKLDVLPPELRRRFPVTMFFDLPAADAREDIWKLYRKRYGIDAKEPIPESIDWTGAEIENTCKFAYQMKSTLEEAAQYVVPVAKSAAEQIKALRTQAQGRFVSAAYKGVYKMPNTAASGGRRDIDD